MVADEFKYEAVSQRENKLRANIIKDLISQGYYAVGTNDRFISGLPDFRFGIAGLGQLDVELKYIVAVQGVIDTGLRKLQFNTIRDMNAAGMPAIALTYVEDREYFVIHRDREIDLDSDSLYVIHRSKAPGVIDGRMLLKMAYQVLGREIDG